MIGLTDLAGAPVERVRYSAYGVGRHTDVDMYLARRRWYDAGLGRWMSRDPLGVVAGFNLYAYASSPIGASDPSGLAPYHVGRSRSSCDARCRKFDRYNWDTGKPIIDLFGLFTLRDDFFQSLHRQGMASEFDMRGEVSLGSAGSEEITQPWRRCGKSFLCLLLHLRRLDLVAGSDRTRH